jgi:hypothetical protein
MSDLDDISCIIRAETGCNYASGDKAAVAVLAWLARRGQPLLVQRERKRCAQIVWETTFVSGSSAFCSLEARHEFVRLISGDGDKTT